MTYAELLADNLRLRKRIIELEQVLLNSRRILRKSRKGVYLL